MFLKQLIFSYIPTPSYTELQTTHFTSFEFERCCFLCTPFHFSYLKATRCFVKKIYYNCTDVFWLWFMLKHVCYEFSVCLFLFMTDVLKQIWWFCIAYYNMNMWKECHLDVNACYCSYLGFLLLFEIHKNELK